MPARAQSLGTRALVKVSLRFTRAIRPRARRLPMRCLRASDGSSSK
ncbi:hypothetical protein [Lysobacter gummosus]